MECSGQFYTPAASTPEKKHPVAIRLEAGSTRSLSGLIDVYVPLNIMFKAKNPCIYNLNISYLSYFKCNSILDVSILLTTEQVILCSLRV
jgi:hypothetical protein